MISQIDISGFRSIKEAKIPLKKLNILYGQNGSGKSSVMYAPYVFRNFCVNPNQRLNRLFDLGFMNLGGFEDVKNDSENHISVEFSSLVIHRNEVFKFKYGSNFSEDDVYLTFQYDKADTAYIPIDLPYANFSNQEYKIRNHEVLWNGLFFQSKDYEDDDYTSVYSLNKTYEQIKNIEVISVKRGFFNSLFSIEQANEESLFAMQIKNEGSGFEGKIDYYFRQLFNKTFRFVAVPGISSFFLKSQDSRGKTVNLVNEGFGVNQTVYMLIKLLKKSTSLSFIEEPEIHLHPSAQAKLVDVFAEIVQKENKQIFLTTHSENIVSSVLAKIANGELSRDDVQFYLAKNEDDETKIIPQEVNDKGQIEGGLMNFMEAELGNLKSLLGL